MKEKLVIIVLIIVRPFWSSGIARSRWSFGVGMTKKVEAVVWVPREADLWKLAASLVQAARYDSKLAG